MKELEPGEELQLRIVAHGTVQGVNFRSYTKLKAQTLGLTGWVRNMPNDTVEAVAEGTESKLVEFADLVRLGPPAARVTSLDLNWQKATGDFEGFEIRF